MNRLSPRLLVIIALIFSLISASLIYSYLSEVKESSAEQFTEVVVAAKDLPMGTILLGEMLKIERIPQSMLQPDSIQKIEDAVGIMTRTAVNAGTQLTKQRLAFDGKMPGFVGTIPADKRAVTIGVNEVSGGAGFIKPGEYVDVIGVNNKNGKQQLSGELLLQNILVLAVNKADTTSGDNTKSEAIVTATLAVAPDDAIKIVMAQQQGTLSLMQRPYKPTQPFVFVAPITAGNGENPVSAPVTGRSAEPWARPANETANFTVPSSSPLAQQPLQLASPPAGVVVIRGTKQE